jgi:hypothetical protein
MVIPQARLLVAAQSTKSASSILLRAQARASGIRTAFLSYTSKDRELALGLKAALENSGWKVYIDVSDGTLPETASKETAVILRSRIEENYWFMFLATQYSAASKWCPWEIGVADGMKGSDRVLIATTSDASGKAYGVEYLQLYRRIGINQESGEYEYYEPGFQYAGREIQSL